MKSGELRRWSSSSNGDPDVPFLVMSIDGGIATFMDDGEVYFLRASTVEELSDPVEVPNDQG
jgi:hypothetical protein